MPVVTVYKAAFLRLVGKTISDEEMDELCFQLGLELDDITSEANELAKGQEKSFDLSKENPENIQWKIEVPANRYDLLCLDGLARAFRLFLGLEQEPPHYRVVNHAVQRLTVLPTVEGVRKFMVCATLRNVDFTKRPGLFTEFLNLQDKLHQNICRKRKLVSVGTHDLDKVQGPFSYGAEKPEDIVFVPLQRNWMQDKPGIPGKRMNARELFALLREVNDPCAAYLPLIESSPVWPVLRDARGEVLSLPPILNGNYSAMSERTRNVFIDVTAIDYTKAVIVLNTIVAMFSEFCDEKFTVEQVEIVAPDSRVTLYPDITERPHVADIRYINSVLGLDLDAARIKALLKRMGMRCAEGGSDASKVSVLVPITRSDVMHECDVAEDVAIAFGYDKLVRRTPFTRCFGGQFELNKFTDLLRAEVARCGYSELLTEVLVSWTENFDMLCRPRDGTAAVVSAPKSRDFEIARTTLIAGLLKSLRTNRGHALPVRVFQIDDVVLCDENAETKARNERRLCIAYCNRTSGLENVHGILDKILQVINAQSYSFEIKDRCYDLVLETDNPTFLPGKCVSVMLKTNGGKDRVKLGVLGIIHPNVLKNFQLTNPVSVMELNLEILERYRK